MTVLKSQLLLERPLSDPFILHPLMEHGADVGHLDAAEGDDMLEIAFPPGLGPGMGGRSHSSFALEGVASENGKQSTLRYR